MSPIKGRSQPQQGGSRVASPDPDTMTYLEKRKRNNDAVKKSRTKAKEKTTEMEKKVNALKSENDALELKIVNVQKELEFLKELFMGEAERSQLGGIEPEVLESLLEETDNEPRENAVQRLVSWMDDSNQ